MGSDQYCLRWNSYETNILATFEGLLDSEALSDVTLFCEGNSALNLPRFAGDRACNSERHTVSEHFNKMRSYSLEAVLAML